MPEHQDGGELVGKHRGEPLRCNFCKKKEGDPVVAAPPGFPETTVLLQDLQIYADDDRPLQRSRDPDILPEFLIWCLMCAVEMHERGDGVEEFKEFGFEKDKGNGPYARYLADKQPIWKFTQN